MAHAKSSHPGKKTTAEHRNHFGHQNSHQNTQTGERDFFDDSEIKLPTLPSSLGTTRAAAGNATDMSRPATVGCQRRELLQEL